MNGRENIHNPERLARKTLGRESTNERWTVTLMAQGDPGLPGGGDLDDIRKARERRGKWHNNEPAPEEPTPENEDSKEAQYSFREAVGTFYAMGAANLILYSVVWGPLLTLGTAFGAGVMMGRSYRSAAFTSAPVLKNIIGFGFGTMLPLSALAYGISWVWPLPLVIVPLVGAGMLLGYYDETFFGLRRLYTKGT